MLEVIGKRLLDDLNKRYPEGEGYLIRRIISSGSDPPITTRWDIYLSRGKFWKFKLALEVLRTTDRTFFHVSLGRDLDKNGTSIMLGIVLALISLTGLSIGTGESSNTNVIAPVLIGSIIGGFVLSLPIRLIVRPYIMMKAKNEGIEEDESSLTEKVNEVLWHDGQLV
jgi:hypothetical protein